MMEKLALPGEGGGAHPPPFTNFTITYKVAVYAPAEWADMYTHPFSYLLIYAGLRIRIHFIRIRIQHFRLNTDPDPGL
jgi:hypothetical protein